MKRNRRNRPPRSFNVARLFRVVLLAALLLGLYAYLRDLRAPSLTFAPDPALLSPRRPLQLTVQDSGTGLKSLRVVARQGGQELTLLEKFYQGEASAAESCPIPGSGLSDGPLELLVEVRDQALFPFGGGNRLRQTVTATVDTQPPTIDLLSGRATLWQGGAALIAYRISEEVARSGVEAGGHFFPGYKQPSGVYLCVVALPVDEPVSTYKPKLVAVDPAGNSRAADTGLQPVPRRFPLARIPVSDAFLANKTDEFHQVVADAEGIELFLRMNRDVRAANRKELTALAATSAPTPLWSEAMLRMPRAKTTGDYAEARDYFYEQRQIDHQTHLGTDLASVAQAPILAANPGKVVFAGYFGIYGGCVVIDHGLGVQTLYGHMSAVEVEVGEMVARGQDLGRSGKTGMAAGDHLHFEVLVGGVPVRPEDWMSPAWMQSNILEPMKLR